jgi:hypothetical protein
MFTGPTVSWCELAGDVVRVPLGGGAPEVVATGQPRVLSIALDRDFVCWTNGGTAVLRLAK